MFKNLWSKELLKDIYEEFLEVYEVGHEIHEKIHSKIICLFWDAGEVIINLRRLDRARDWKSWRDAAEALDRLEGKEDWKKREQSHLYDYRLLRTRLKLIKSLRESNDIDALVHHLRSGLLRSLGGCLNPSLYTKSLVDTKHLIADYQEEVCKSLKLVLESREYPNPLKLAFFSDSRIAFGKTAFVMSGGGGLGLYHLGVAKALYDQGLLPRIIAGTSAGSMVAAFLGTTKWENIPKWFQKGYIKYDEFSGLEAGAWKRKITRLIYEGHLMNINIMERFLRTNIGEITFEEAYEKTGTLLNITVSESSEYSDYRLLNYLTAPHVLVWSAVLASCAVPFIFPEVELKCKNHLGVTVPYHPSGLKFIDGSIKADLPFQKLSELFNVNAFIVSQTNPWIIPLLTPEDGGGSWGDTFNYKLVKMVKKLILMEFYHRVQQLNLLSVSNTLTWILGIFTQQYRGHVTIWPVPSIKDYLNILSNPTDDDIQRCTRKGQLRTFPKINMLKSIMVIEKEFDSCYHEIKERMLIRPIKVTNPNEQPIVEEDIADRGEYMVAIHTT